MNSHESPWVFLFSRFTSEALLFEGLLIFSLVAVYSAFFVLRKRKYGSIKTQVPAGVVKYYLNELIGDAEQIRAQLFGLLSSSGVPATGYANAGASNTTNFQAALGVDGQYSAPVAGGPTDTATLKNLESKLADQAKQIENFIAEKSQIEKELVDARLKGANTTDSTVTPKLQEKITVLEAKLAEYSVIEDDLANLKRLQQENAQLKASLKIKTDSPQLAVGPTIAEKETVTSKMAAPAEEASIPAPTLEAAGRVQATATIPEHAANIAAKEASEAFAAKTAVPETPIVHAAAPGTQTAAAFEGLVDQVEKSLSKPRETPVETAPSTTAALAATIEKSDADLVAEFEKMLNS